MSLVLAIANSGLARAGDLTSENWRVFNGDPGTAYFWDINKASSTEHGVQFPVQAFDSPSSGSFVIYLLNNYNVDLTGKTISATMSWSTGPYDTRHINGGTGAYVWLEFQDTTSGTYNSNDYWWSVASLDLNGEATTDTLTADLADCSQWANQSGKSACDITEDWVEWQGDTVHMSPADGFIRAMSRVKEIGLSFGDSARKVNGIARVSGAGSFTVSSYLVSP